MSKIATQEPTEQPAELDLEPKAVADSASTEAPSGETRHAKDHAPHGARPVGPPKTSAGEYRVVIACASSSPEAPARER